ncbi:hypothetical protein V4833_21745 [Enterobacter sp. HK169]|uniref:hypothetical protein n=1 Tax=Enterobacter sp. HK169 TaxID=1868135 RepID=UPI002F3FC3BA
MTKKFEDMPLAIQDSVLRVIEHRLSNGCPVDDNKDNVESILAAYSQLLNTKAAASVGEIIINVSTVNGSK